MTTVYAALRDRLLVCEDGSGEWTTTSRLEGHDLECLAASSDAPERVFVGTFESGLHRSTDGGDSFESLETEFVPERESGYGGAENLESDAVTAVAISPHDPDVVYAGTEPSRVYRSSDGGDSWAHLEELTDLPSADGWFFPPRPHTHHVRWLEVDPFDPERLYVGIEAGAFVLSTDGGENWQERPPGSRRDNHSMAIHPDREGLVYSAAGDGFARSTDGGASWDHPQEGLEHRYCWSVAPDPGDPESVLVSSASGAGSAHTASSAESYVYRKPGGEPWERLEDVGLPTGEGVVRAELAAGAERGVVYAANNRGLFRTGDFGDSWDGLDVEWLEGLEAQAPRGLAVLEA
ncbi:WD40/YVTN/BNR-like repeat-containing protein [Natronococcus roseus]|uniref:WD40/YVTN/BNR-like repeat-containing protein n=1 Tax=Natronococcus roseus TaxID=1052014 RepID=UPI00374CE095